MLSIILFWKFINFVGYYILDLLVIKLLYVYVVINIMRDFYGVKRKVLNNWID